MLKILFIIISFIFTLNVDALEKTSITIEGENEVENVEHIIINIEDTSHDTLGIFTTLIYDKTKLKLISYYGANNFEMTVGNRVIFDTHKRINKDKKVGTLVFKALPDFKNGEETIIKLVDTIVTDGKKELEIDDSTFSISIPKKLNEGLLSEISINGEKIENFDSRIKEYDVLITNKDKIIIDAKPINNDITIKGVGEKNVTDKEIITITATDKSGEKDEYKITVYKEKENIKLGGLKSLTIENYDINFSNNIYNYELEVPYEINELNILAIPTLDNSIVKISNNNLSVGKNTIIIEVLEENGMTTNYYINVLKNNKELSNNLFIIIILIIIFVFISTLIGIFVRKKMKNRKENLHINL